MFLSRNMFEHLHLKTHHPRDTTIFVAILEWRMHSSLLPCSLLKKQNGSLQLITNIDRTFFSEVVGHENQRLVTLLVACGLWPAPAERCERASTFFMGQESILKAESAGAEIGSDKPLFQHLHGEARLVN
jgi:hypothetical protein